MQRGCKIIRAVRELLELRVLLLFLRFVLPSGLFRVVAGLGLRRGREYECGDAHLPLLGGLEEILALLVALLDFVLGHLLRGAEIPGFQRDVRRLGDEPFTDEFAFNLRGRRRDRRGEQAGDLHRAHIGRHEGGDLRFAEALGIQQLLHHHIELVRVEFPILPGECLREPFLDLLLRCGDAERGGLALEEDRIFHALRGDLLLRLDEAAFAQIPLELALGLGGAGGIDELRVRASQPRVDRERAPLLLKRLLGHGLAFDDRGGRAAARLVVARAPQCE